MSVSLRAVVPTPLSPTALDSQPALPAVAPQSEAIAGELCLPACEVSPVRRESDNREYKELVEESGSLHRVPTALPLLPQRRPGVRLPVRPSKVVPESAAKESGASLPSITP